MFIHLLDLTEFLITGSFVHFVTVLKSIIHFFVLFSFLFMYIYLVERIFMITETHSAAAIKASSSIPLYKFDFTSLID